MEEAMLKIITPTFLVLAAIGIIGFLSKNLILERLKNAIRHDYVVQHSTDNADAMRLNCKE